MPAHLFTTQASNSAHQKQSIIYRRNLNCNRPQGEYTNVVISVQVREMLVALARRYLHSVPFTCWLCCAAVTEHLRKCPPPACRPFLNKLHRCQLVAQSTPNMPLLISPPACWAALTLLSSGVEPWTAGWLVKSGRIWSQRRRRKD